MSLAVGTVALKSVSAGAVSAVVVTAYITVPCEVCPAVTMAASCPAMMPSMAAGSCGTVSTTSHLAVGAYCGVSTTSLPGIWKVHCRVLAAGSATGVTSMASLAV